jgi:hypothetical protein
MYKLYQSYRRVVLGFGRKELRTNGEFDAAKRNQLQQHKQI